MVKMSRRRRRQVRLEKMRIDSAQAKLDAHEDFNALTLDELGALQRAGLVDKSIANFVRVEREFLDLARQARRNKGKL